MKFLKSAVLILMSAFFSNQVFAGAAHIDHAGKNPNSASACKEAKISHFKPQALATAAPGSEFSFTLSEVHDPNHIEVTVKKIPVTVTVEVKNEDFAVVHGKLPEELKNTAARINVKIKGKQSKCNTEEGWLIKISG